MYPRTNIAYELPSTVKSPNNSWSSTYQTSTTVIGLFVGVEAPLLFFFKDDSNIRTGRSGVAAKQTLLALGYSSLFLSLGAAVSGLILTNKLRKAPTQTRTAQEVLSDAASSHGYEGRLIWVARHWVLSVIGGIVLPTVQVLLYVWLEESNTVRFTLSAITLYAMLPIVFVLLPSPGNDKHSIVSSFGL